MITHSEDGRLLFPHEYCVVNNIETITENDCFCHLKSNATSIINFFQDFDISKFERPDPSHNIWRSYQLTPEEKSLIISNNDFLSKVDCTLKIADCYFLETSENAFVAWHFDANKGPVLNLLLTPEHTSYSLFSAKYPDTSSIVECKYIPNQFCLYNTEIIHCILNLHKPRYLFTVIFEEGKQGKLNWNDAKEKISLIG